MRLNPPAGKMKQILRFEWLPLCPEAQKTPGKNAKKVEGLRAKFGLLHMPEFRKMQFCIRTKRQRNTRISSFGPIWLQSWTKNVFIFSFRIKLSKAVGIKKIRPFPLKTITALLDYYCVRMNNIDKAGLGRGLSGTRSAG